MGRASVYLGRLTPWHGVPKPVCLPTGLQRVTEGSGTPEGEEVGGESDAVAAIDALVDEYRTRCLWFVGLDYYPKSSSERLRVLGAIERNADLAGYRRASILRQWLSRNSSATSASD